MVNLFLGAKRFLRSPRTIVAELLAIAAAGAVLTAVPQESDLAAHARFAAEHPAWMSVVQALLLDRVVQSPWFLTLVLLAAASLAIVVVEQWRLLARQWREQLTWDSFRSGSYRRELERPARPGQGASERFTTRGRLGQAGTPLFHVGLLVVVLAGAARGLFAASGSVAVVEGELLPSTPWGFSARSRGLAAPPAALPTAVRLVKLRPSRYPSGAVRSVSAEVVVGEGASATTHQLAVNEPLDLGSERLYVTMNHGPAAVLAFRRSGAEDLRALLLEEEAGAYEGRWTLPDGLEARLRANVATDGGVPSAFEARVLGQGALLFYGPLVAGDGIALPGGERLELREARTWAVLEVSRDFSANLAYLGFALTGLGVLLMFAVVRVDTAVVVTPTAEGERVSVGLRASRFAPLFAERFEELVEKERSSSEAGP